MSDTLALIRAVLAEDCADDDSARRVLDAALEQEVDPLLYCSVALGLDQTLAMERAAAWANFAFYPKVPERLGRPEPIRIEELPGLRLFVITVIDRRVAVTAPDFFAILRLKQRLSVNPRLRNYVCLVPVDALRDYVTAAVSDDLVDLARQGLARRWPYAAAQLELTKPARYGFVAGIVILLALILMAPYFVEFWLLPVAAVLLIGPAAIRLAAAATHIDPGPPRVRPPDEELPVYSVLIPLCNEAAMVPQLFQAMRALDYPATRLDIKFVVEAASIETVAAVEQRRGAAHISLVTVPDTQPRTKPKALGYALPLCRGELVVVYDAEDLPEPDQLWKAAVRFREKPDLVCLQAQLRIANGGQNWLAALFAGEYAALFTVLLPALAHWRLPLPLGGTSNHFRVHSLRMLGGWDAFNVTEDADLGVRLARRRLRVETLDSATNEHAPTRLRAWHGQRTRWMKGWMQTFIVHNRNPGRLVRDMGLGPTLAFEVLVLGMILAPLLHTGLVISAALHLLRGQALFDGTGWAVVYAGILLLGYLSTFVMTIMGLARSRQTELLPQQLLLPGYWLLMALATLRALRELALRPFHWFKSPHLPVLSEPVAGHATPGADEIVGR